MLILSALVGVGLAATTGTAAMASTEGLSASTPTIPTGGSGDVVTTGSSAARGALLVTAPVSSELIPSAADDCEPIELAGEVSPSWLCGTPSSVWDLNRSFTFALPDGLRPGRTLDHGQIRVIGTDLSTPVSIVVGESEVTPAPAAFTAAAHGDQLVGTGTPGARIRAVNAPGDVFAEAVVDGDGTWSATVWRPGAASSLALVVSHESAGTVSDRIQVTATFA